MSDSNSMASSSTSRPNSKRLLFDRRYGWVLDEWKDPAEVALAEGRGMFCIVPLARTLFVMASQSINLVGRSTVEVLKRPELLSPQVLQSNLKDQLQKLTTSLQKPGLDLFALKTSKPTASASLPEPNLFVLETSEPTASPSLPEPNLFALETMDPTASPSLPESNLFTLETSEPCASPSLPDTESSESQTG